MNEIYKVHAVTVGSPHAGVRIDKALEEAKTLGLDFIVFNGFMLPVGEEIKDNYMEHYPRFHKPSRLKGEAL